MRNSKLFVLFSFLLISPTIHAIDGTLQIGTVEGADYGYSYNGQFQQRNRADFNFKSDQSTLQLNATGFDIDYGTEVKVSINGTDIGYLATSASEGTSFSQLSIPRAAMRRNGNNVVTFTQAQSGARWGITDILIKNTPVISPGVTDTNEYGNNFNGDFSHPSFAEFRIPGKPSTDTELIVVGYDVDSIREVAVLLNNTLIGYLEKGPDNGAQASRLTIPANRYSNGENILRFKVATAGSRWGVKNININNVNGTSEPTTPSPPPPAPTEPSIPRLAIGLSNADDYGFSFRGVSNARETANFSFESTGDILTLTATGYDIDFENEVAVLINGNIIGYLETTPDDGTMIATLAVNIEDQVSGMNTLTFMQSVPGFRWGVTNIMLTFGCNYPLVQN